MPQRFELKTGARAFDSTSLTSIYRIVLSAAQTQITVDSFDRTAAGSHSCPSGQVGDALDFRLSTSYCFCRTWCSPSSRSFTFDIFFFLLSSLRLFLRRRSRKLRQIGGFPRISQPSRGDRCCQNGDTIVVAPGPIARPSTFSANS